MMMAYPLLLLEELPSVVILQDAERGEPCTLVCSSAKTEGYGSSRGMEGLPIFNEAPSCKINFKIGIKALVTSHPHLSLVNFLSCASPCMSVLCLLQPEQGISAFSVFIPEKL